MGFNKKFLIPIVTMLCLSLVAAAVIWYQSTSVDVTVNEALSQSVVTLAVGSFPGETQVVNFTVDNAASVPLKTVVTFTEDLNAKGVSYTTDLPKTVTLAPGSNVVSADFAFAADTTVGNLNGTVTFERTA